MAVKKTDERKNRGLTGYWTRFTEEDDHTKNSYLQQSGGGAIALSTLSVGSALCSGLLATALITGFEYGDYNWEDYDTTVDRSFDHNHIGVNTDDLNIVLVQDEDSWRVYQAHEKRNGDRILTYVDDADQAYNLITSAQGDLMDEYNDLAAGRYHEAAELYKLSSVSGIYQNNDDLQRYAMGHYETYDYDGLALENRYGDRSLGMLQQAADDLGGDNAIVQYGFLDDSTPVTYINEDPAFTMADSVDVMFPDILPVLIFSLMAGIPFGAALGALNENVTRRKRKGSAKSDEKKSDAPRITNPDTPKL